MSRVIYALFAVILVALLVQIYQINKNRAGLVSEMATISEELDLINVDNADLQEKINYYSDPHNLEKELRARFNYRLPYEKLIIVVPQEESGSRSEE